MVLHRRYESLLTKLNFLLCCIYQLSTRAYMYCAFASALIQVANEHMLHILYDANSHVGTQI